MLFFYAIWAWTTWVNISTSTEFDEYLFLGALVGVPIALIRLFEPFVFQEFK